MSWISGWWKDEKKDNQEEKEKENLPNLGTISGEIKNSYAYEGQYRIVGYFARYTENTFYKSLRYDNFYSADYVELESDRIYAWVTFEVHLIGVRLLPKDNAFFFNLGKFDYEGYYFTHTKQHNGTGGVRMNVICEELYCYNDNESKSCSDLFTIEYSGDKIQSIKLNLTKEEIPFTENSSLTVKRVITPNKIKSSNGNRKYEIQLMISKNITKEYSNLIYEYLLPLNEKGWMNEEGYIYKEEEEINHDYQITAINENWWDGIWSGEDCPTLDLGERMDLDISYFKNVYVKTVYISIKYKKQIEKEHPFKYWSNNNETNSVITYYDIPIKYYIENISITSNNKLKIEFSIIPESEYLDDKFLDNYISNDNELLIDVQDSDELSNILSELNLTESKDIELEYKQLISEKNGSKFNIQINSKIFTKIHIIWKENEEQKTWDSTETMNQKIKQLYCINTNEMNLDSSLPELELTIKSNNINVDFDKLVVTNMRSENASSVNLIVNGDITKYYPTLPDGVNTINAPPIPGKYLEGESTMDLSNVENFDLTKFGELDENGKFFTQETYPFTSQKIFLSKITITSGYSNKVEKSQMRSSNKMENNDSYALTEINSVIIMDDNIPTNIKTSSNDNTIDENTIRIQLYGDTDIKRTDCMQKYVDGTTLNIKLSEGLSNEFNPDKSKLELYIVTIDMKTFDDDEESNKIEFFFNDVNKVSVHYGEEGNNIRTYDFNSFTTHLDTLNITYIEKESNSSIKTITYFSNEMIKVDGLQNKVSKLTLINKVKSINTLVTGNITSNKITLVNEGYIPEKMYTEILPINENNKHYIKSDGTITNEGIAQLVAINESLEDEYLPYQSNMNLMSIENVNNIDISKFGEGVAEDGSIIKQNVFLSSILAYDNDVIKDKFTKSKLKSRNQVISHSKTLGEGEVEYADTQYRFGNPNLVQCITNSDETNYEAIQLYFTNQYNNEFLNDEIINEGDDWNLILDLNNKPTDPNDSNSPSTSDQFRNMMNNNDSLLLFVKRLETIGNISFWNGKNVTNIQIYYYNENGEYVNEPKTFTKFKTKIEDAYCAVTYEGENNKIYLSPITYEFSTGKIIVPANEYENMIDIINNLYVTGKKFNNNNNKVIRSQKINLFINGTIPAWIFRDVLPLMIKTETETHYRFIESSGYVYRAETGDSGDLQIIGINDKPNIENVLFPSIDMNGYIGSSIDLSNISGGTAIANTNAFDRMMVGTNKIFFVNKVTLLERFKERINIEGVFQYYEGEPTIPKNCVYNAENPENGDITYVDDWALKLPECYEGCEINQNDSTQLIMNFGIYEQLDPDAYLLKNVLVNNYMLYLDVSMSTIDVRNINKVKLYLEKLKYFNSKKDITYGIYTSKDFSSVVILFNMDGFIASKSLNYMNVIDVINKCYVIGGTNKLENSIRLVEPLKNAFMIYDNKKCIAFRYENRMATTINEYKCTNIVDYYNDTIRKINLLVAGEIPTWLMEYMPLPIKLNKLTHDTTYGSIFEFTNGDDYSLQITSVNALPTPDGDVGIDNIN